MFLYKVSRFISFTTLLTITLSFYLLFVHKQSFNFEELLTILLSIIVCICPLLIFNWLCFKKITLWIEKPNEEHFK